MQFNVQFDLNLAHALIIGMGLLFFGIAYNYLVAWLENANMNRPYTAVLVVVGTLITLLATLPLIGLPAFLIVLAACALSGAPMIVGSMWRYGHEERARDKSWRDTVQQLLTQNREMRELMTAVDTLVTSLRGDEE